MGARTKFLDPDYRREPRTNRYCIRCQRDLKPGQAARQVHLVNGGSHVVHPMDEALYCSDAGDMGGFLIGLDCAKKLGLEWSIAPEKDLWKDKP